MTKRFVMLDGLDGSGKGVALEGLKEWAVNKGLRVLDLKEFYEDHDYIPEFEEVQDYEVLVSVEPTYAFVGKALRDEIIRKNKRIYTNISSMHAFALDREILYKRLLIPAIKDGKYVFQDRGVVSSIVYQPVQGKRVIPLSQLLRVPGNRVALEHAPGLLIITQVEPEVVMGRLERRSKKDDSVFDTLNFQRKIQERYSSPWLRSLFEGRKCSVVYLDTNPPKTEEDTKKGAVELFEKYLLAQKISL